LCEKLGRDGVAHACGPKCPEKGGRVDILPEEDSVQTAGGEERDHQEGNNQAKKVLKTSCSFVKSKYIFAELALRLSPYKTYIEYMKT
jgi:hypothetical protein